MAGTGPGTAENVETVAGMNPGKNVAANVRRLRKRRGLTAQALSDRLAELGCRMERSAVAQVERGGRRVYADELVALASALDVDLADLFVDAFPAPRVFA